MPHHAVLLLLGFTLAVLSALSAPSKVGTYIEVAIPSWKDRLLRHLEINRLTSTVKPGYG